MLQWIKSLFKREKQDKVYIYTLGKITRFEYISKENGREIVRRGNFEVQFQDGQQTLKIFEE